MIKATNIIDIIEDKFANSHEQFSIVLSQWKKKLASLGFVSGINKELCLKAEARIPLIATEFISIKQSNKLLHRYIKDLIKYFNGNADAQLDSYDFSSTGMYIMNPNSFNHDIQFDFYYIYNNLTKKSCIRILLTVSFSWGRKKLEYLKTHEDEIEKATTEYCEWMMKILENIVKTFRLVTPEE